MTQQGEQPLRGRTWATPWGIVLVEIAGAAVLLAAGLLAGRASLAIGAVAAGLLAAMALRDSLLRPTLRADHAGLVIVDGLQRRCFTWNNVEDVRAARISRRAAVSDVLEVDAGDVLVLVSRRRLGAPPREVAAALVAFRQP